MTQSAPYIVVIGVGNPDRGDDAAGRAVAKKLMGALPAAVQIAEHDGEATSLLERLDGATRAFLIDACSSGAPPGTLRRFDAAAEPLPQQAFRGSTHAFGVAEAIELARALDRLPPSCILYAIEGASYDSGAPLSFAAEAAVAEAARRIEAEIAEAAAKSMLVETSLKSGRGETGVN